MAALGLVLFALAAVLTGGVAASNTGQVSASAFGVSLSNVSVGGLFLLGVATGLVGLLGLGLIANSAGRRRRLRREARTASGLQAENAQLRDELAALRSESTDQVIDLDRGEHRRGRVHARRGLFSR